MLGWLWKTHTEYRSVFWCESEMMMTIISENWLIYFCLYYTTSMKMKLRGLTYWKGKLLNYYLQFVICLRIIGISSRLYIKLPHFIIRFNYTRYNENTLNSNQPIYLYTASGAEGYYSNCFHDSLMERKTELGRQTSWLFHRPYWSMTSSSLSYKHSVI